MLINLLLGSTSGVDCANGDSANNNCISSGGLATNHMCDNGGLVGCVSTGGTYIP